MNGRSRHGLAFASLDFLVCVALWLLVQLAPPPKPASAIRTFGLYAVVLTWPQNCHADLDLYVRQPSGEIVYFSHANGTAAHLEHDDLGTLGAYHLEDNLERTVIRSAQPGEYVANVHVYDGHECRFPAHARVELWRLSGADERVFTVELRMRGKGDEQTAFRFSLGGDGSLGGVNRLPRRLIG